MTIAQAPMRMLQGVALDTAYRAAAALITGWFAFRFVSAYWQDPRKVTILLFLTSELVSLLVILLSRRPSFRDSNPLHASVAIGASFLIPVFMQPQASGALAPETVTAAVAVVGVLWTIYAKLSLGRSFGLVAARRGVKIKGAYQFVRHPIYFGYFWIHLAFLLANFCVANLAVFCVLYVFQVVRALREEDVLSQDETYRDYCKATPYRFVYGLV